MTGLDFNTAGPQGAPFTYRAASRREPQPPPDLRTLQDRHGGDLYDGGRSLMMPGPGHSRTDRSLSLKVTPEGRLVWHSFADDPFPAIAAYIGLEADQGARLSPRDAKREQEARMRAAAAERAHKLTFCAATWAETLHAAGSPVEAYLRGRGITGPVPDVLRFHPAAPLGYRGGAVYTAMVAMVTGPDDKFCGLHVTAIKPDGSGKADLANPRRMFGDMAGAAVRLSDVPDSGELAVGEGLETMLAYRDLTGAAVWACLSTGGLRGFTPPTGLVRLTVAADGDEGGLAAAHALVARASRRCACAIVAAPEGKDWNDVLMETAR